jgi:hypothetical protein
MRRCPHTSIEGNDGKISDREDKSSGCPDSIPLLLTHESCRRLRCLDAMDSHFPNQVREEASHSLPQVALALTKQEFRAHRRLTRNYPIFWIASGLAVIRSQCPDKDSQPILDSLDSASSMSQIGPHNRYFWWGSFRLDSDPLNKRPRMKPCICRGFTNQHTPAGRDRGCVDSHSDNIA